MEDEFCDVSDDSGVFHVAAKPCATPRADEDRDLAIAASIVPHLRDYQLLPLGQPA